MEGLMCSYKQIPLPKLKIAQEMNRRDSLSSSRTGDSGYNSDPDISLSPLEFQSSDQVPYTSAAFTFDSSALFDVKDAVSPKSKRVTTNTCNSILFKKHQENHHERAAPKIDVTSAPTTLPNIPTRSKPDWTNAFKKPAQKDHSGSPHELASLRPHNIEQWISVNSQPNQHKERNSSIISLSSTGSCDMYSNTDDNSDDEDVGGNTPSTLSKATLKTIELIMRKIEVNLGYAAFMQCAGSQSSRAQGSTSSTSRAGRGASQGSGGKRKARTDEGFLPPEDPDEDGSNKRRRVSITTTTEDSETGPRFACPFYKHDPNRYRSRRTCPGPGWPTVHRMKEHLYRSHAQPIFCNRCYSKFNSDRELANHQRADPCEVSTPQPIDGASRETLDRVRKRSAALRLEEDKWRDTYQILFPEVSAADIPSPYYDSASPTEDSRRFRRELLERIRQELFATAELEPDHVEQRLLHQVAKIIQRCESDMLTSRNTTPFDRTAGLLHPTMPTNRRASAPSILVEETTSAQLIFEPPTFPPGPTYTPAITSTFHPSQTGPMTSPRTPNDFNTAPQQPGAGPLEQNEPPSITYLNPFTFESSEWIDWPSVFPPGLEVPTAESTEAHPTLSTPVWT